MLVAYNDNLISGKLQTTDRVLCLTLILLYITCVNIIIIIIVNIPPRLLRSRILSSTRGIKNM